MADLPTCGKPCPEHGTPCPTVDWKDMPPEEWEIGKMVANCPAEHMLHLCLHDPKKPHTWTEEAK